MATRTHKAKLKTQHDKTYTNLIPIVDLFAGPGGLGEGFSSVRGDPFRIIVSAEMEASAHNTLKLRAFYRLLKRKGGESISSYYRFCNGSAEVPFDETNTQEWIEAGIEAQQLTLGDTEHNIRLDQRITHHGLDQSKPWVLIGGPPCQAYSLVGRARNRGNAEYRAEEDNRHYLYKEYLRIIGKYKPSIFVMENVKGILSASVGGKKIFQTILRDLSDPAAALGDTTPGLGYKIYSLSCPTVFSKAEVDEPIDIQDFILKAEDYGIPQARHRVILLGVREDITFAPTQLKKSEMQSVRRAIGNLPRLRSTLSKEPDSSGRWAEVVRNNYKELSRDAAGIPELSSVRTVLKRSAGQILSQQSHGALRYHKANDGAENASDLTRWYSDSQLSVWLNHEARGHMIEDLRRYAYAASFAEAKSFSPKGHLDFSLPGLRPNHENWETGKFSDRFRVQMYERPATTVTSHISKDGHYFIHPDPSQCRSLTVREAARLQTFPDNYFFQGNRTQQFHQVGNAVPPLLAKKIGEVVHILMKKVLASSKNLPTEK